LRGQVHMASVRTVKARKGRMRVRQNRQSRGVTPGAGRVITDRRTLKAAREMVAWITDKARPGAWSLRRLSRYTPWGAERFGNWQHIAKGSRQVRLTQENYDALRRLYDLLQDGYGANMELFQLALETNEAYALFGYRMNRLMLKVNEVMRG